MLAYCRPLTERAITVRPLPQFTWQQPTFSPEDLIISEIASNGGNSYLEITPTGGNIDLDHHYGVYVLKPHHNGKDIILASETIIPGTLLQEMINGQKHLLIGNPDPRLGAHLDAHIAFPSPGNFHIYVKPTEWLDFGTDTRRNLRAILVTKSKDPLRLGSFEPTTGRELPKVTGEFYRYLYSNQIDGLVIKSANAPNKLNTFDKILKKPKSNDPKYLTVPPAGNSLNRCQDTFAFDPSLFQPGLLTPGYPNACPAVAGSQEGCPLPDPATTSLMIKVGEAKRRKIEVCKQNLACLNSDPNDPDNPNHTDRRNNIATALNVIRTNQADIIDPKIVIKHALWFQYFLNPLQKELSTYGCYYCMKYAKYFDIRNPTQLALSGGVLKTSKVKNTNVMNKHPYTGCHKKVMKMLVQQFEERQAAFFEGAIDTQESHHHIVTNRHMRTVFMAAKNHQSFNSHARNVELQILNFGSDAMGSHCAHDTAARDMTIAISDVYKRDLITKIKTMGTPFSVIIDGSTDRTQAGLFCSLINNIATS